MTEREEFEAWALRELKETDPWFVRKFDDGRYKDSAIQNWWTGWQAARASSEAKAAPDGNERVKLYRDPLSGVWYADEPEWEHETAVFVRERAAPAQPAEKTALQRYKELNVEAEESDPLERLRAFCSFAMRGDDWIDVEPFFDAVKAQPAGEREPVITLVVERGKPMTYRFHRDVWGYGEYDLFLEP